MKKSTVVTVRNKLSVKKILLAGVFLVTVATGNVRAAGEPEINNAVKASFNKEFAGANLLEWNKTDKFLKATFILGNHRTEAYFTEDGHLEGSIRSLFYNELPLVVMTTIDKRFTKAEIWDVNEINNSLGTVYRINLVEKNKKYTVRSDANGHIKDIERVKK